MLRSATFLHLSEQLVTTPNYLLGYERKENLIADRMDELLNRIKDEKVKEMLIAQLEVATQFA